MYKALYKALPHRLLADCTHSGNIELSRFFGDKQDLLARRTPFTPWTKHDL